MPVRAGPGGVADARLAMRHSNVWNAKSPGKPGLFSFVTPAAAQEAASRPVAARRERRSKNSAWLITAFSESTPNGLVMRKAGSGG